MKEVTFRIVTPSKMTYEQLITSCDQGSKFVAYIYLIPRPIFPPIKRLSKIFLINPNEVVTHSKKYNLLNLIWGWWGLPFGPVYTYTAIKQNRTGLDYTEDVLVNLDEDSFHKGIVVIKKSGSIFIHPDKETLKVFLKGFKYYSSKFENLERKPIIGKFIDTENPYYVIGLSEVDTERAENIKKAMYKYFYSHVVIEFLNLEEETEMSLKLIKQGLEIDCS